jgi:hypothetical protein
MKFCQAHRLVWIYHNGDIPEGFDIDHINRDKLDNCIENLRLSTKSENNRNSNKSDHYNVGVWRVGSKFGAYYNLNGKKHYVGRFETEQEAILARQAFIQSL